MRREIRKQLHRQEQPSLRFVLAQSQPANKVLAMPSSAGTAHTGNFHAISHPLRHTEHRSATPLPFDPNRIREVTKASRRQFEGPRTDCVK